MARDDGRGASLPRRLAWFVGLWAAGVAFVFVVSWLLRLLLIRDAGA